MSESRKWEMGKAPMSLGVRAEKRETENRQKWTDVVEKLSNPLDPDFVKHNLHLVEALTHRFEEVLVDHQEATIDQEDVQRNMDKLKALKDNLAQILRIAEDSLGNFSRKAKK